MAKTKPRAAKKKAAPPIEGSIRIRMADDYKAWLERLAEHCQTNVSGLFAVSVAQHAKATGFDEKPPRRVS
jgi:hypothetical protein